MYSFSELFATYLSAETVNVFNDAEVKRCVLNSENRSLDLELNSKKYIHNCFIHLKYSNVFWAGFPGGSVVQNPPANAGDIRNVGSISGSGRSPGEGHGNSL